jgi:nucleoside-diphosphate-sugar epimerase
MNTNQGKRVFVAGATGAIGKRLCQLLVRDGWHVIGTTRHENKQMLLKSLGVEPVVVDAFDQAALCNALGNAQAQYVVHQLTDLPPALHPQLMPAARIRNAQLREEGTRNLVAAATAAGCRRMVAQSIAFAYAPGAMPYDESSALDMQSTDPAMLQTVRAVNSLEQQVLNAPFAGVVLRYGRLYGPGTGFDHAKGRAPLHVDAAAHAARLALNYGGGVYNIAEEDGTVTCVRAHAELGWSAAFRIS